MTNLFNQSMNVTKKFLLMVAAALLCALSMASTSLAQSTSFEQPTPLTSNSIQGEFHQNDPGYFFTFGVDAGVAVKFTLDLAAKNYGGALYITLFDRNGRELAEFDRLVMKGQTAKLVQSVRFEKTQDVILRVYSGNGEGYYRLTLSDDTAVESGPVGIPQLPPAGAPQLPPAGIPQMPPVENLPQPGPAVPVPAPSPTPGQPTLPAPVPMPTQSGPYQPAPAPYQNPPSLTMNFKGLRFKIQGGSSPLDSRALNPQPLPPKIYKPVPPSPDPYSVNRPVFRITKKM